MKFKLDEIVSNAGALFTDELWTLDTTDSRKSWKKVVRFVKIVRITLNTFAENRMGFQCVSLSYFCTLAIIPLMAFVFAVSGGLGLSDKLLEILYKTIPADPGAINLVMEKAGNIINTAKSGIVGFIGALTFLWAVIWLMFQVERVFNNVWGIRKIPRKMYKRFSFYLMTLILIPFIVLVFGIGIVYYTNLTKLIGLDLGEVKHLPAFLGWVGTYIISTMTFSLMYKWIPAAKIKYSNALKSAAVSGLVFVLFQYLYLETQVFMSRINDVYGVLAAIPLFLIWLNFSWQIIIYGAGLTYSYENVDNYQLTE
ncbi:MAG: YihY/virulence factor BrkB family protein [Bacteroidales bacterium]|nr:YihY/virulence factor BrkB family protein [Bacteroidales bacterium]